MEIKNVKLLGTDYFELTFEDGTICTVPKVDGCPEYEKKKQWESNGGVIEPEFTEAELVQQAVDKKIAEAKVYLASTDFKMAVDYDEDVTEIKAKRAEARAFIRANS